MNTLSLSASRQGLSLARQCRAAPVKCILRANLNSSRRGCVTRATSGSSGSPESSTEQAAAPQPTVDYEKIISDVRAKWDGVDNKPAVAAYTAGSVVSVFLSITLVSAINSVPVLPKFLELVGLVYSSWFTYRYLLFKTSREELSKDINELKQKISGKSQ